MKERCLIDLTCGFYDRLEELSHNCFVNVEFYGTRHHIDFPSFSESSSQVFAASAELAQTCLRYKKVAVGYNCCDSAEPIQVLPCWSPPAAKAQVYATRNMGKIGLSATARAGI